MIRSLGRIQVWREVGSLSNLFMFSDFQPTQQALGLRSYVPYQNAFYPPMSSVNDLPYIKQEIVTSDVKHGEDGNFGKDLYF